MRFARHTLVLTVLIVVTAISQVASNGNAADKPVIADADKVYPKTYRVSDLPVWKEDGKTFDPAILMAYVKSSVDPTAWNAASSMAPYPKTKSIVAATTSANHDSITKVLESLRPDNQH